MKKKENRTMSSKVLRPVFIGNPVIAFADRWPFDF